VAADGLFGRDGAQEFALDGIQEFAPYGTQEFGPDGTQEPIVAAALGDALGGLVTGPAFEPGDWLGDQSADEPDSVYSTGATPLPPAPDQQQLRSAMDKAMMTGPPTNPLRVSRPNPARRVRPAPTVTTAVPQIAPPLPQGSRRAPSTPLPSAAPTREAAARSNLAGRPALRTRHPVVSALIKLALLVIVVVLVLLLHNYGGTLSGLF